MDHFNTDPLPRRKGIYIVGGSLRDCLLGRIPTDVDIAVRGDPETLASELATKLNGRVIALGRADHPMFRVVTPNRIFDIAPLQGATIEEDLKYRDFTINALACETVSNKLIDITQGLRDLQDKQIRQVSKTCFQADPLRLLRAFRIAAQLGFKIEGHTLKTIQSNSHLITKSAAERVRSELFGLLGASQTHEWLRKMADTGILFDMMPEMTVMKACPQNSHHTFNVFEHSLRTVHHMEALIRKDRRRDLHYQPLIAPMDAARRVRLKLAALLHDVGKPLSMRPRTIDGHVSFKGHAFTGARIVADLGDRLRFSRNDIEYVAKMVRYHQRPMLLFNAGHKKTWKIQDVTRFFMKTHAVTPDILLLSLADMRAKHVSAHAGDAEFELFIRKLIHQYNAVFRSALETPALISGHDLIHHLHLVPSPIFKRILSSIRERQITGQITTRNQALKFAAHTIASGRALEA
jgi:putative nucleotidyltransferase with HDIG domain